MPQLSCRCATKPDTVGLCHILRSTSSACLTVQPGQPRTWVCHDPLCAQSLLRGRTSFQLSGVMSCFAPDTAQWIFTDGKGNRIVEDLATKKFEKYAKDAKLSEDVHFHSMRHTFATIASNNGMTPNILKAIKGHASIKTTEGYSGSDTETMRDQMKKVLLQGRPASAEEVKREDGNEGRSDKGVAEEG